MPRTCRMMIGAYLLSLWSCRTVTKTSDIKEELNAQDAKVFGLRTMYYDELITPTASEGFLPRKPWFDDYWPTYKTNMARRYFETIVNGVGETGEFKPYAYNSELGDKYWQFADFKEQKADLEHEPQRTHRLSPAEKYDLLTNNDFELTKESWVEYEDRKNSYAKDDNSWHWEGICHGWAQAAYSEDPPLQHVKVKNGDREVLFFEGDIRGLLSKAYAHNAAGGVVSIGSRCNIEGKDIVTDGYGRPYDAVVVGKDGNRGLTFEPAENSRKWKQYKNYSWQKISSNERQQIFYLAKPAGPDFDYWGARAFASFASFKNAADHSDLNSGTAISVKPLKQCRDLNPAELHMALTQLYSGIPGSLKRGIVLEMDRAMQVWNHPLWGYRTIVGALIPVEDLPLKVRSLHFAQSVTHVAKVQTKTVYVSESGPSMTYRDKDLEAYSEWKAMSAQGEHPSGVVHAGDYDTLNTDYWLEFIPEGDRFRLVGGEWDESGAQGYVLKTPDFAWFKTGNLTDTDQSGLPSPIRYSVVKQILTCSRDKSFEVKEMEVLKRTVNYSASQIEYKPEKISYVDCDLTPKDESKLEATHEAKEGNQP